ncbi:MAG: Chromosome partition protein smc [Parcubacteria group bacterium Gr01-1014_56]|nr:MAG: Chromosome partition protein smc [Parcubacteria group bacterium Gr01-1014_56]
MRLKSIELSGFKSFAKKTTLEFAVAITSIVGPNGSGKSNIAESFRFVLGEQSMKSMRGRRGEDLIWNGSGSSPRAGRAGAKLIFDNADRTLNLDFDEVAIERVVYRDGVNDYLLNGSSVRLRDIAELLAQANIGASAHHIISQGEADRILSASTRERREMIEDALGLTAYLYKREEAEKKLEKTAENVHEVEAMRREIVPHLKFLGTQVKKIEEAENLRENLKEKYKEYLKRESVYLSVAEAELKQELAEPKQEHAELDRKIERLRRDLGSKGKKDASTHELIVLEGESRKVASRRDAAVRELGRIEGELGAHERIVQVATPSVPVSEASTFANKIQEELEAFMTLEGQPLRSRIAALIILAKDFMRRIKEHSSSGPLDTESLRKKKSELEQELKDLAHEEERIMKSTEQLRRSIESEKDASREAERELFQAMTKRSGLEVLLAGLRSREEILLREQAAFKNELAEAGVLIGKEALQYETYVVRDAAGVVSEADMVGEERGRQEERRKKLERMKIKLEEIGAGNSAEVLKEYKETTERDQFLARELSDLEVSSQKLHGLIEELTKTLETRFVGGIDKINKEFTSFFTLMFGGGSASLSVVKEKKLRRVAPQDMLADIEDIGEKEDEDDEEIEEGIDITVALPHKRIKGLHMLSGGERALTSIALIFAMSQVNPPPFLILDETDAALDEANSKRYGDMIENLAKKSQLILITHNRETMSRAGILYGVTMNNDGISKLLSVKFEDALAVAK